MVQVENAMTKVSTTAHLDGKNITDTDLSNYIILAFLQLHFSDCISVFLWQLNFLFRAMG